MDWLNCIPTYFRKIRMTEDKKDETETEPDASTPLKGWCLNKNIQLYFISLQCVFLFGLAVTEIFCFFKKQTNLILNTLPLVSRDFELGIPYLPIKQHPWKVLFNHESEIFYFSQKRLFHIKYNPTTNCGALTLCDYPGPNITYGNINKQRTVNFCARQCTLREMILTEKHTRWHIWQTDVCLAHDWPSGWIRGL